MRKIIDTDQASINVATVGRELFCCYRRPEGWVHKPDDDNLKMWHLALYDAHRTFKSLVDAVEDLIEKDPDNVQYKNLVNIITPGKPYVTRAKRREWDW